MANRKGIHIYIPKYFMAVRNCINIFVLVEVLSIVWSIKWNEPAIHYATAQLVIPIESRFFCAGFWRFRSLYDLEAIPIKSVGQETVFVGRGTVLFD